MFQQKELDAAARAKGLTVIPDCGLAPGMVNILAQHGISQLDTGRRVKIFVGGLPQHPEPPLNYQIVYSLEGVLDYYTTLSWVLRDGKRTQVKALSELEPVKFPAPVGELEAFHTAGGLSTMAFAVRRQDPDDGVQDAPLSRATRTSWKRSAISGCSISTPLDVRARKSCRAMSPSLSWARASTKPEGKDLVALRVIVEGAQGRYARRGSLGAARLLRRRARHQRDDAHHRLLALDHRADAGARRDQPGRRAHAGRMRAAGSPSRRG